MAEKKPEDISAALAVPFPQEALKWRWADRAQTRKLDYVQGHTVIHRLIDATGNRWDFTIDKIERTEIDAQNVMLMAYVTLDIPGLGRRQHIGVQSVNARGGEDLVKGAVTDALKKAATLFGVGLELYGPDYEAGELPEQPNLPARSRTTSQNTIPDEDRYPSGVTKKQVGAIGAIASEKGIPPDVVKQMHGKASAKLLTAQEASALIEQLKKEPNWNRPEGQASFAGPDPNRHTA